MRLLRDRVLEDDHRPDDLLTLDVRDVEALDADRQRLEVERLPQLLERLEAARALGLAHVCLRVERELRILLRELLEAALLAALGRTHLDARRAPLGEERLERTEVARSARHEDLRRDRRRAAVVLEAELLEHLAELLAGGVF